MATKASKEATAPTTSTSVPTLQSTLPQIINLPCAREYYFQMALVAWGYCRTDLSKFFDVSDRYTATFIDDQELLIGTVKLMDNLDVRQAAATAANDALAAWRQQAGSLSKRLDNAIGYAFKDAATADAERKLSGLEKFGTPSSEPWGQVDDFLTTANKYLREKITVLVEAKAAKANLQTQFSDVTTGFTAAWNDFIAKMKAVEEGTNEVNEGLRAIQKELNPMLEDGKLIYEFDPVNRKKFTIKDLIKEVRGTHPAGLAGYVRNEAGKGIENARVQVDSQPDKFALTDKKGKFELKLSAGKFGFSFTAAGMVPQTFERSLTAGVTSRQNVELVPVPVEAAPAVEPVAPVTRPAVSANQQLAEAVSQLSNGAEAVNGAAH